MQDFKLGVGGAHFQKLRRAEGGAKMFGVFRVKNHDFTPTNHIFSNFGSAPAISKILSSSGTKWLPIMMYIHPLSY